MGRSSSAPGGPQAAKDLQKAICIWPDLPTGALSTSPAPHIAVEWSPPSRPEKQSVEIKRSTRCPQHGTHRGSNVIPNDAECVVFWLQEEHLHNHLVLFCPLQEMMETKTKAAFLRCVCAKRRRAPSSRYAGHIHVELMLKCAAYQLMCSYNTTPRWSCPWWSSVMERTLAQLSPFHTLGYLYFNTLMFLTE